MHAYMYASVCYTSMTSTVLQQQQIIKRRDTQTIIATTVTFTKANMAWTNEKLRFSCMDNIGLKQLWKLIALDSRKESGSVAEHDTLMDELRKNSELKTQQHQQQQQQQQHGGHENHIINNHTSEKFHLNNCEDLAEYLTNREILPQNRTPLLKFLAINALELSAPASLVLLQQKQQLQQAKENSKPQGWMQLSGHPESIVPTSCGIVRKRISSVTDNEVHAYKSIALEPQTLTIVPAYFGIHEVNGEHYIELQDLLSGFKDPCVMDIKMGCRTFLESEVSNRTLRPDLYNKMISVDANAPTAEEHAVHAITKLRYMLFREAMSSSHAKGFRIEALRLRGCAPVNDLKTCRTNEQINQTIEQFLTTRKSVQKELIKRLKYMRLVIEQSVFFNRHEIIGSSIFIVYDNEKVGAWLIDFAKSRQLPDDLSVTHRADWRPGNREEGLLKGMDELIHAFEEVYVRSGGTRKCLQI